MPIGSTEGLSSPSPLDLLLRILNAGLRVGESPADVELNQLGSLMGSMRANPRAEAQRQGPLRATLNRTLELLNPINWMGGFAGPAASIPLAAWRGSQAMQPEARAALNVMADRYPQLMQRILSAPTRLRASVEPLENMPTAFGTLNTSRATTALAKQRGDPALAENPIVAAMRLRRDIVADPQANVAKHEGTHFINFPRVQRTDPADAATIGLLLNDLLPRGQKNSLAQRLQEFNRYAPLTTSGPTRAVTNPTTQAALRQIETLNARSRASEPLVAGGEGYYKPGETTSDLLSRAMMDEGLAYLSEQTGGPRNLSRLAEALDVSGGAPTKEDIIAAGFEYID